MRRSSRLVLGLTTLAVLVGTPAVFAQQDQLARNLQQMVQRYYREQQQQQRELAQAIQKRNQEAVKRYQEVMKKRQEAYVKQMEEFKEQGYTAEDIVRMQREYILSQVPRSQRSALKRKWARQDRIRRRALERARRTGDAPKEDDGLELGGLGDIEIE